MCLLCAVKYSLSTGLHAPPVHAICATTRVAGRVLPMCLMRALKWSSSFGPQALLVHAASATVCVAWLALLACLVCRPCCFHTAGFPHHRVEIAHLIQALLQVSHALHELAGSRACMPAIAPSWRVAKRARSAPPLCCPAFERVANQRSCNQLLRGLKGALARAAARKGRAVSYRDESH